MKDLVRRLAQRAARLSALIERRGARRLLGATGLLVGLLAVLNMLGPTLATWSTWGGHDWDEMSAQRYLVVTSLRQFGQLPFWNPYACGGHSAWASIQGATNLVSPWLPFYLWLDLRAALRVEVLGMALISAAGAWFWSGRFTQSPALRALVVVLFAVNGRFALQAATGHAWHLYYGWTPWVLVCFDRALAAQGAERLRDVGACAALLALMVYHGGIYPLPQTGLLLGVYALAAAATTRKATPLLIVTAAGALAVLLAAPKLLPVLVELRRYPRLVESPEVVELNALIQLLTAPDQTVGSRPARVSHWGWHEYGMYVGWVGFFVLGLGLLRAKTPEERCLRWPAVVALLLGLGAFHRYAPWSLLHELPIFSSQHVPSRWLFPGVLFAAVLSVAVLQRLLRRAGRARALLELLLLPAVALVGWDVSSQSARVMASAFWMEFEPQARGQFRQEHKVPRALQYRRRDYAPPALPAMMANVGVIECTMHPGLNVWAPRDAAGRIRGLGAEGTRRPGYRGEVFLQTGTGSAVFERWTPNELVVQVTGAAPGDRVVVNQNWAPGWSVDGAPALDEGARLAAEVSSPNQRFVFRYRPPLLLPGLLLFGAAVGGFGVTLRRHRKRREPEAAPLEAAGEGATPSAGGLGADGDDVEAVRGLDGVLQPASDGKDPAVE